MWSVECLSSGNHICTNDYISQLYTWYYTGSVTCSCTRYCPLSISQENHKGECLQSDDLEQVWLPVITWPQTGVAVLCHINNKWDTPCSHDLAQVCLRYDVPRSHDPVQVDQSEAFGVCIFSQIDVVIHRKLLQPSRLQLNLERSKEILMRTMSWGHQPGVGDAGFTWRWFRLSCRLGTVTSRHPALLKFCMIKVHALKPKNALFRRHAAFFFCFCLFRATLCFYLTCSLGSMKYSKTLFMISTSAFCSRTSWVQTSAWRTWTQQRRRLFLRSSGLVWKKDEPEFGHEISVDRWSLSPTCLYGWIRAICGRKWSSGKCKWPP